MQQWSLGYEDIPVILPSICYVITQSASKLPEPGVSYIQLIRVIAVTSLVHMIILDNYKLLEYSGYSTMPLFLLCLSSDIM
jgi:hypothetical protein